MPLVESTPRPEQQPEPPHPSRRHLPITVRATQEALADAPSGRNDAEHVKHAPLRGSAGAVPSPKSDEVRSGIHRYDGEASFIRLHWAIAWALMTWAIIFAVGYLFFH